MPSHPSSPVIPAALYVRLSKDDGESTALVRQEKESRAFAEREGYTVVRVYSDNDVSAYSGAERPAFKDLLADVKAGKYAGVIAWKFDRLTRSIRSLADFTEACDGSGTWYRTVVDGIDSRQQAAGVMTAITAALAGAESKNISLRQKAKKRELKEQGKAPGGGIRPYGHSTNWAQVVPEEAEVLQEAAERVLAGEPVNAVCRDFNARGIPTVKGGPWRAITLRDILQKWRLAGARELEDGSLRITGAIEPILNVDTVERLRSVLTKRGTGRNVNDLRYLLSGVALCGLCGAKLCRKKTVDGQSKLQCPECGKIVVRASHVEQHVTRVLMAALNTPEWNEVTRGTAIAERVALVDQVEKDRARIESLTHDHSVEGIIDRQTYLKALKPLTERVQANEAKLAVTAMSAVLDDLVGTTLEDFLALPMSNQRAVLSALIESVTVMPVGSASGPVFKPERVQITWKV